MRLHLSGGEKPLLKVDSVKTQQREKVYRLRYNDIANTIYKDGSGNEWIKRDKLSDPKAQ